ncbi:restriction endonuclease subunit S [Halothiobacillus sp.]|uniref:restriction endonuclease subunit S n=1 Tax=Halothiobacillus sp. TaxID=1891311 RepID=UPI00263590BB|nr:restriction endonuclease subunit S [Halothiobacillus sp.]
MKAGWKTKSLGDVCKVIGGGTPSKDNAEYYSGEIHWATVRDMRSDVITETECKITKAAVTSSATNIIPSGNVVIATRVGLGKVCLLGQDTAINQDLRAIVPINPSDLAVRFLFWWLKSTADLIVAAGTGATVQGVKLPFVKSLQIPLPPIHEQHRIVAILDEAFDGIAKARANVEQNRQNARALFESHLQSVFTQRGEGWISTTLGKATGGIYTGPFGSLLHKSDYVTNGIPLVNPAHISATGIEPDMQKTVSKETAERLSSYIMREGDIVIGRRGEMGRCALVTSVEDGWLCGTGCFFIKPSERCDSGYLVRFLRSDACKQRLEKIAGGAVMPNLSNTDLGNLSINLPPLEQQKTIVGGIKAVAAETQRLESLYQQKLAALDELKKSLLHQVFSGQL